MVEARNEDNEERQMVGRKRQRNKVTNSDLMDLSIVFNKAANNKRQKVNKNSGAQ